MAKILVVYFSAGGTTKRLAGKLAEAVDADLFEIVPEAPYTRTDLNWMDKKSRSSIEMNDPSCRPSIRTKVEDMSQYDVVFVGFPIWWYREPSIIDTFMEAYDFSGKTVVPFATSGGSGMGSSGSNMQKLAPGAKVAEGKRFGGLTTAATLKKWADEWI